MVGSVGLNCNRRWGYFLIGSFLGLSTCDYTLARQEYDYRGISVPQSLDSEQAGCRAQLRKLRDFILCMVGKCVRCEQRKECKS